MRRIALIFFAAFFGLLLIAGATPEVLHFPGRGFSIAALESPDPRAPGLVLNMLLPATDGFAPNVNVVSQPSGGTLDDYISLSRQGTEKAGLKIISLNKIDANTVTLEYAGTMRGKGLHWYAKASLKDNNILLVTASCAEIQWPRLSAQLKACVNSFQRNN